MMTSSIILLTVSSFYTFAFCDVLDRDYPLESKLHDLEYDIEALDYESRDYTSATDEIELTIEELEENLLTSEFGISAKKGQQNLSCGRSTNPILFS